MADSVVVRPDNLRKTEDMRYELLAVGIMTGNSLDGVDAVLTRFTDEGTIEDLISVSISSPTGLTHYLRVLRDVVMGASGDVHAAEEEFSKRVCADSGKMVDELSQLAGPDTSGAMDFELLHDAYIGFLKSAVDMIVLRAQGDERLDNFTGRQIDLIGMHGQTCAHFPPSIAKSRAREKIYTVQLGSGQRLADRTGVPVVYDFRSDDLMNGGEAAPLAPLHHEHLAALTRTQGVFPIAFCNAGNTGNVSIISEDNSGSTTVLGWDIGPFNHFPDLLMQRERDQHFDVDGEVARSGTIHESLLRLLFEKAVVNQQGENFLLAPPPKSSDPQWYLLLPELTGERSIEGQTLSFEDRLRTAIYFSSYIYAYSLSLLPENISLPLHYALCGGGWKNPVVTEHFRALLEGNSQMSPILNEHAEHFAALRARLRGTQANTTNASLQVSPSKDFGFDGTAMEARIFADAAVSRILGRPFSLPATTGTIQPTICGVIRLPNDSLKNASLAVRRILEEKDSRALTVDGDFFPSSWNRASRGWSQRLPGSERSKQNYAIKV